MSIIGDMDLCEECYRDGEIVPGEVSTEDGYFCRACADLYASEADAPVPALKASPLSGLKPGVKGPSR